MAFNCIVGKAGIHKAALMPFQESKDILSRGYYQSELDQLAALLKCECEAIKLKCGWKPPCNTHLNCQISKKLQALEHRIKKLHRKRLTAPTEQTNSCSYRCLLQKIQYSSRRESPEYTRAHYADETADLGYVGMNVVANTSSSLALSILQGLDPSNSQEKVTQCRSSRDAINAAAEKFSDFYECQHGLRITVTDPAHENELLFRGVDASKAEFDSSPFASNSFRKSDSSAASTHCAAANYNEQTDNASNVQNSPHLARLGHSMINLQTTGLRVPTGKKEFCRNDNFARDMFVEQSDMIEAGDRSTHENRDFLMAFKATAVKHDGATKRLKSLSTTASAIYPRKSLGNIAENILPVVTSTRKSESRSTNSCHRAKLACSSTPFAIASWIFSPRHGFDDYPTKKSQTPVICKASSAEMYCRPTDAKSNDFRMPGLVADTKRTSQVHSSAYKTAAQPNDVDSVARDEVTDKNSCDQLEVLNFDFSESDLKFIASMESWLAEIGYPNIRSIPVELFDTDYLEAGDLEIDGEIFRKVFGVENVNAQSQTSPRPVDYLERKTSDYYDYDQISIEHRI